MLPFTLPLLFPYPRFEVVYQYTRATAEFDNRKALCLCQRIDRWAANPKQARCLGHRDRDRFKRRHQTTSCESSRMILTILSFSSGGSSFRIFRERLVSAIPSASATCQSFTPFPAANRRSASLLIYFTPIL